MNLQLADQGLLVAMLTLSHESAVPRTAVGGTEKIDAVSLALEQERHRASSITKEAGVFGIVMPHKWGGVEFGQSTQIRIVEARAMLTGRWVVRHDQL